MICIFIIFFVEIHVGKQNSPRWDATFSASHLGLICLPLSYKNDVKLIWANAHVMRPMIVKCSSEGLDVFHNQSTLHI